MFAYPKLEEGGNLCMSLTAQLAFLKKYLYLIEQEKWDELFRKADAEGLPFLYDVLMKGGIDVLNDYHQCPPKYAMYCTILPPELDVPEGVEDIGANAFRGTNLERVHLPNSLLEIGPEAFKACKGLAEINIPESVQLLGAGAFENCQSLVKVDFGSFSDLEVIEGRTFKNTMISELYLPEGIKDIYSGAFASCKHLQRLGLPKSLQAVDGGVILGSPILTTISYAGTKEEFTSIRLTPKWIEYQSEIVSVFCSDGQLRIFQGRILE